MSLLKLIAIASIGLVTTFGSVGVNAAQKKINRLFFIGDSLSDDGGYNSTWYLLNVLNGKEGDEGIDYIQPWVRGWLSERIPDYGKTCSINIVPCKTIEKEALKGIIKILKTSGEVPILPPSYYYKGRWSNGLVWSEYLSPMMGIPTSDPDHYINVSHGGSWSLCIGDKALNFSDLTGDLKTVAEDMVNGSLIPPCLKLIAKGIYYKNILYQPNDMIMIFFGANDYLNLFQNPSTVIQAQTEVIEEAIDKGAKNIVWMNLPDIGKSPRYLNGSVKDRTKVSDLVSKHNQLLKEQLDALNVKYAPQNIKLLLLDVNSIFDNLLERSKSYGFSVIDQPCSTFPVPGLHDETKAKMQSVYSVSALNGQICNNPKQHVFWDDVHPTTTTHKIVAQKVCEILLNNGFQCNM